MLKTVCATKQHIIDAERESRLTLMKHLHYFTRYQTTISLQVWNRNNTVFSTIWGEIPLLEIGAVLCVKV